MTINVAPSVKQEAIARLGAKYEPNGFRLVEHPVDERLPVLLRKYRPDVLLVGPAGNNMVVELRELPGSPDDIRQSESLARDVRNLGDWSHQLMIMGPAPYSLPSPEDVSHAIEQFDRPTEVERLKTDFVRAWAIFEAAARLAGERLEPGRSMRLPTAAVLERLTSFGALEDSTLSELEDFADLRNRLVHGGLTVEVPESAASRLIKEARRLLEYEA
jgi:REase_AHJR-like